MFLSLLTLLGCSTLKNYDNCHSEDESDGEGRLICDEAVAAAENPVDCDFTVVQHDGTEATINNLLKVEIVSLGARSHVDPGLNEVLHLRYTAVYPECGDLTVGNGLMFSVVGDSTWISEMAFSGVAGISDDVSITYDTGSSLDADTWYPWMKAIGVSAGSTVDVHYWVDTTGAKNGDALIAGMQEDSLTLYNDEGVTFLANEALLDDGYMVFDSDHY